MKQDYSNVVANWSPTPRAKKNKPNCLLPRVGEIVVVFFNLDDIFPLFLVGYLYYNPAGRC